MDTPKLSTMVVLYTLNLKLKTDALLERLPLNEGIIKVEKRGVLRRGESSRDKIRRRSKKNEKASTTGFGHNSITIVMMNNGNGTVPMKEITIKIFQNGVFHMTGVLDDSYDKSCIAILLKTIWDECHDCITDPPEKWEVLQRRVVGLGAAGRYVLQKRLRHAHRNFPVGDLGPLVLGPRLCKSGHYDFLGRLLHRSFE